MGARRIYRYCGSADHLALVGRQALRLRLTSLDELPAWMSENGVLAEDDVLTLTYIVATDNGMWVSDRRTEHVVCADGQPVLAAGELSLNVGHGRISLHSVSNQSTGYCPEPACWPHVAAELQRLDLEAPDSFTHAFDFRRCDACGQINIVRDAWFHCAACDETLDGTWNFN